MNRVPATAFKISYLARRRTMAATKSGGSKRGFAAMDPSKQREIASKGGKASHGGGRKSSSSR
jgi:general stress protein YciG